MLLALEHLHERNVVYRDLKPETLGVFSRVRFDHALSPELLTSFIEATYHWLFDALNINPAPYQLGAGNVYFTHQQLRLLHWQSIAAWVHLKPHSNNQAQWHSDIVVGSFALCQSETFTVLPCQLFPAMFFDTASYHSLNIGLDLKSPQVWKPFEAFLNVHFRKICFLFVGHKKTSR